VIILEYKTEEVFELLEKTAMSLYKRLCEEQIDCDDVEFKTKLLKDTFIQLKKLFPNISSKTEGDFKRHLGFIIRYPEKFGEGNIKDIINNDIPAIRMEYIEWIKGSNFLDPVLRSACENLLCEGEFDSAVRKAFIVFKERAITKFSLPSNLDGEPLVNKLFASDGGKIKVDDDISKRKAFRDYCSGLFGYFRNSYAHNMIDNPEYSADAVLTAINMLLKIVDEYEIE
jgi:hypothetical protein